MSQSRKSSIWIRSDLDRILPLMKGIFENPKTDKQELSTTLRESVFFLNFLINAEEETINKMFTESELSLIQEALKSQCLWHEKIREFRINLYFSLSTFKPEENNVIDQIITKLDTLSDNKLVLLLFYVRKNSKWQRLL